jgi:hypothetical protein
VRRALLLVQGLRNTGVRDRVIRAEQPGLWGDAEGVFTCTANTREAK